jgi:hypothetical protein
MTKSAREATEGSASYESARARRRTLRRTQMTQKYSPATPQQP